MELLTNITLCAIGLMVLQAGKKLEEFDKSATKKETGKILIRILSRKIKNWILHGLEL